MNDCTADSLYESFARPLAELCPAAVVRRIEAEPRAGAAVWSAIDELGYADALVPAAAGGAGLALSDVHGLLYAAGESGLPFPFGDTVVARALLARAGHAVAGGACTAIAQSLDRGDGAIVCGEVPGARLARQFLVAHGDRWLLLPATAARLEAGVYRRCSGSPAWPSADAALASFPMGATDAATWLNAVRTAEMAGALHALLRQTIAYAQERTQFGRPLGRFQAVQQDISVLAEQVASAAMAARLGCAGAAADEPHALRAAMARLRACEAVPPACAIAHAVHGAIGVTEELPLGLVVTRLREWRATGMSEQRCATRIGARVLDDGDRMLLDFILDTLAPA